MMKTTGDRCEETPLASVIQVLEVISSAKRLKVHFHQETYLHGRAV